jgi:hypothetical protein
MIGYPNRLTVMSREPERYLGWPVCHPLSFNDRLAIVPPCQLWI